jgi:hypothetical protein
MIICLILLNLNVNFGYYYYNYILPPFIYNKYGSRVSKAYTNGEQSLQGSKNLDVDARR